MNNISGKKELIFDISIKLISNLGFENINLRELAKQCGIKASSIYNHYSSKNEILNTIYEYYKFHFLDNMKQQDELKSIIAAGSRYEIIDALFLNFISEDTKKYRRMILITKIIYARIFTDNIAADIFHNIMTKEIEIYLKNILDYGVSINKFKSFDTKTFSSLLISSMHMMGINALSKIDYEVKQLDEENDIKNMFAELLPIKE